MRMFSFISIHKKALKDFFEPQINGLKLLFYNQDRHSKGFKFSFFKTFILSLLIFAYILVFIGFSKIEDCIPTLDGCSYVFNLELTLSLLIIIFIGYVTIIWLVFEQISNFWGNNKLFKAINTKKWKILIGIGFIFFGSLGLVSLTSSDPIIEFISLITMIIQFIAFPLFYIGPYLYYLWLFIEPYLLLTGIFSITHLITAEIPQSGYGKKNRLFLVGVIIGTLFFTLIIYLWVAALGNFNIFAFNRGFWEGPPFFDTILLGDISITYFIPVMSGSVMVYLTLITIILSAILVFWVQDKVSGRNTRREDRKSGLAWILFFSVLLLTIRVIPVSLSIGGSFVRITNYLELFLLALAVLLGILRVLTLHDEEFASQQQEKHRFSPRKIFYLIPQYVRVLILFVISFLAFFFSLQSRVISAITGEVDLLKITRLNILVLVFGFVTIILIHEYRSATYRSPPGILTAIAKKIKLIE